MAAAGTTEKLLNKLVRVGKEQKREKEQDSQKRNLLIMRLRIRVNLQAGDFKLNFEKPVGTGRVKSLTSLQSRKKQYRPNL